MERGRHGINSTPDLVQILIMFADDVILASYTVCGLQNQLNILWETADLGLVVNLHKSNTIVFRNGRHVASLEKWVSSENVLTIVNMYEYLGLSTRLTFSHELNDMAQRAKEGGLVSFNCYGLRERGPC